MADNKPIRMNNSRIFNISGKPSPKTAEILAKIANVGNAAGQVKTASVAGSTKTVEANLANFKGKAAEPFGKKDEGKEKGEKKEGLEKEECDMVASAHTKPAEIKVAEGEKGEEKYDAGKTEGKLVNDPELPKETKPEAKESGAAATTTTKTPEGTFPSSGQTQWEGKPENNNKPEMPTDKNTEASAKDILLGKLAKLEGKFIPMNKQANLKPEVKKNTKDYWRNLYDEEYADAMTADK